VTVLLERKFGTLLLKRGIVGETEEREQEKGTLHTDN
jgi:hypothetical protein